MPLTSIKNENVINDSLFAVALSTAENDQVLTELSGWMAVSSRWRLTRRLRRIDLFVNTRVSSILLGNIRNQFRIQIRIMMYSTTNLERNAGSLTYLDEVPGVFLQVRGLLLLVTVLGSVLTLHRGLSRNKWIAHGSREICCLLESKPRKSLIGLLCMGYSVLCWINGYLFLLSRINIINKKKSPIL